MISNARALWVATVLSLGLFACGDEGEHDEADRPMQVSPPQPGVPMPVAPTVTPAAPTAASRSAKLVVVNNYPSTTITGLYLSPSDTRSWGTNQLNYALTPGDEWTLTSIPCNDYYDLLVERAGGVTVTTVTDLYFTCGYEKTVTLGAR